MTHLQTIGRDRTVSNSRMVFLQVLVVVVVVVVIVVVVVVEVGVLVMAVSRNLVVVV